VAAERLGGAELAAAVRAEEEAAGRLLLLLRSPRGGEEGELKVQLLLPLH